MLKVNRFLLLVLPCTLLLVACGSTTNLETPQNKPTETQSLNKPSKKESPEPPSVETSATSNFTYEIQGSTTYQKNEVKITYPVIESDDADKKIKANELIKSEALKGLKYYEDAGTDFSLDIQHQVKLQGPKVLSIQYQGIGSVKGAAHPNNLFYTTTIDVEKGQRIRLQDLVKVDESFAATLKEGKWKALNPEQSTALNGISTAELTKMLLSADSLDSIGTEQQSDTFSYLTKDSLGISLSVSHAAGDHAEFEIKFDDLASFIQSNNEIWNDIKNR